MKKTLLTLILIFNFAIQKTTAQFIDEIEITPFEFAIQNASNNFLNKYSTGEKTWMISLSADVKLNKAVHPNIVIQLGVRYLSMGYKLNFWSGTIEDTFLELRNEAITVPMGMENLVVRRVNFRDNYLTIPMGGKYFLSDSEEDFSLYLSGYYQPSFLVGDRVDTDIALKGGFLLPSYTAVANSEFEPLLDAYFEDRKSFISSFQIGLGGKIKTPNSNEFSGEIQWTEIITSIHDTLLTRQKGIGIKLTFTFSFSKKDKETPPLK